MRKNAPFVLIVLDGWGYTDHTKHNAIACAKTPQWDEWWANEPHALLEASGESVGLPDQQMGNSEVGHMHISAGRVIQQNFTRINKAIADGDLAQNALFKELINHLKREKKALHLMGLLSTGGVHSHEDHLFALLDVCHQHDFNSVYLHLFLDGRDAPPKSGLESLARLKKHLKKNPCASISSISGRYYAMDRDQRWDRTEAVYTLLTEGVSTLHFNKAESAINYYYEHDLTDEFIPPTRIGPTQSIVEGDAIFFFNYRADRARQLTAAFIAPDFNGFTRHQCPKLSYFISMTEYDKTLPTQCLFPPIPLTNTLGEVFARHGLKQLRIAETEKYAHVTFFFNGGVESVFLNEDRLMIPSPKVATYDLQPEMSAPLLTKTLIEAINNEAFDVIICNYANADMVGHSGHFDATVRAIECLDQCLHDVWQAVKKHHGTLLITADHGNAEKMFNEDTHQAHTAHTNEPVPLLYLSEEPMHFTQQQGSLIDIAPTMLSLMGITPPKEMTGHILLEKNNAPTSF